MSSTQTEHRADSIEHLDHEPACVGVAHDNAPRPPATVWVNQHGCLELLLCTPCLTHDRKIILDFLEDDDVQCSICHHRFGDWETFAQVVPL